MYGLGSLYTLSSPDPNSVYNLYQAYKAIREYDAAQNAESINPYSGPVTGIASVMPSNVTPFTDTETPSGIQTITTPQEPTQEVTVFGTPVSDIAKSYATNPANIIGTTGSIFGGPVMGFLTTKLAQLAQKRGYLPQSILGDTTPGISGQMFGVEEDPSAYGGGVGVGVGSVGTTSAPPGIGPGEQTSDASAGGSAGADAASAAGANDDADTGGPF